jgi:hypothetical protein
MSEACEASYRVGCKQHGSISILLQQKYMIDKLRIIILMLNKFWREVQSYSPFVGNFGLSFPEFQS